MTLIEKNFYETKEMLEKIEPKKIAEWLLNEGYFPEGYVIPPSFKVENFVLKEKPCIDLKKGVASKIETISFPKTNLTLRTFGIYDPRHYHDMVYYLVEEFREVIGVLFHKDIQVYSYSFPIPINKKNELTKLRAGRLIYEWITMAEKDLVAEAYSYNYIVRTDITNFYPSIYTHSISWVFASREEARGDKDYIQLGNKIDRLLQLSNDRKTNGIPIGSALSDLIAELLLARIDRNISNEIKKLNIDFLAVRFKDDYRVLCKTPKEGNQILKIINDCFVEFNLYMNEKKTSIQELPIGLYRLHDREYFPYSMSKLEKVSYKKFEKTLLIALDIHEKYPGTSILEKFFSELYKKDRSLKLVFNENENKRHKEILQIFSLLILAKRKSDKILCHVLAVMEGLYNAYFVKDLKKVLKDIIKKEFELAKDKNSSFEMTWLLFFSRYLSLGITPKQEDDFKCNFYLSVEKGEKKLYDNTDIELFIKPLEVKKSGNSLEKHIDIFDREKEK